MNTLAFITKRNVHRHWDEEQSCKRKMRELACRPLGGGYIRRHTQQRSELSARRMTNLEQPRIIFK